MASIDILKGKATFTAYVKCAYAAKALFCTGVRKSCLHTAPACMGKSCIEGCQHGHVRFEMRILLLVHVRPYLMTARGAFCLRRR